MSKNNSSKPKTTTVRRIEIVSRLYADDGTVLFDMDKAAAVIQAKKGVIKEYAYIVHDKDTYDNDSGAHKKGDLKPPHVHLLLRFEDNQPQHTKYIAQWFGVGEQFLAYIKGDWNAACLYLIHFNAKDKFQYAEGEVTANFDYAALIEEARDKEEEEKQPDIDKIIKKILDGEIREYNKTLEIDGLTLVNYSRKIELAFKVRSEYLQATRKERQTECIYITGASGCGKTTLAKKIAESRGFAYFVSSGSNDIMDGYGQEPCLIVDDIRPSVLGLSDLLKMLDPHTACSVKSRYKNKYLNCELVILTTVLDINTFYNNVFLEHDEPITQLKRRCSTYISMDKKNIYISLWDRKAMKYSAPVVYRNTVIDEYTPKENVTADDVCSHVSELIPFLELEEESIDVCSFRLHRVHNGIQPKTRSLYEKTISDGEFQSLMDSSEPIKNP